MKILFIDLNETLIESKDENNVFNWIGNWKFKPKILSSLYHEYKSGGYEIIIIYTNQGGIDLGCVLYNDVWDEIQKVKDNLISYFLGHLFSSQVSGDLVDIVISPSKICQFRKPNTDGILDSLAYLNVDLSKDSLMVGDASGLTRNGLKDFSDSDKKFAENLGINYLDVEEFIDKYHR